MAGKTRMEGQNGSWDDWNDVSRLLWFLGGMVSGPGLTAWK